MLLKVFWEFSEDRGVVISFFTINGKSRKTHKSGRKFPRIRHTIGGAGSIGIDTEQNGFNLCMGCTISIYPVLFGQEIVP